MGVVGFIMLTMGFLSRRRQSKSPSEDELMVVAAILKSAQDRRSDSFYRQFAESINLERNATADGYTVKPAWTTSDLVVELDGHAVSRWVQCHDVATGQLLEFRVTLRAAGFFGPLEARAVTGIWPQEWHVDPAELAEATKGALHLPTEVGSRCLPKLLAWLNVEGAAASAGVRCRKGAAKADVDELVAREGRDLPEDICSFLRITDGLDIGELLVFGTPDLYVVDVDDRQHWVIATEDDAYFLIAPGESQVRAMPSHDAKHAVDVAKSFPEWLLGRLTEA
ncbi:MAG TPA: hypothetical protein VFK43_12860 [Acidimicrobiales bacterium]|nr:hypothetical protein [Acidimicrobiales bacterium]